MIVICPKAFAGTGLPLERDFLLYYLSYFGKKAVMANEVWDSYRFRITNKFPDKAEELINLSRGTFTPEDVRLKENYEEVDPKDYTNDELFRKTKNLVERKWAEIDLLITQEPDKYKHVKVKSLTLEEFYIDCMQDGTTRSLIEKFCFKTAIEKSE